MNPFDALFNTNDQDGGMGGVPPMLAQLLAGGGAQGGQGPATEPLSPVGLPPRSPVDNSMVLPMMLMALAQQQSRTRPRGESRTHQNVQSIQDFFTTGMSMKAHNAEEERKSRKSQLDDAEAERRNMVTHEEMSGRREDRAQNAELFPLKKAAAESGLDKAQIELKLKTKELAISDELNKAKLDREKAATDELRSRIDERIAKAEAGLQKIDLLRQELGIKAERLNLASEQGAAKLAAGQAALDQRNQRYHPGKPEEGVSARTIKIDGDKEYHYEFGLPMDVALGKAQEEAKTRKRVSGQDVPPDVILKRAEEMSKPKAFMIDYSGQFPKRVEVPVPKDAAGTPNPSPAATSAGKANVIEILDMPANEAADLKARPGKPAITSKGPAMYDAASGKIIMAPPPPKKQTATPSTIYLKGKPTPSTGAANVTIEEG